jgi:ketosteroid isomerase-like protein
MMRAMTKLDPQLARKLATRAWQAVSSGDAAALEAIYSEDIVWHVSGRGPYTGDHRGGTPCSATSPPSASRPSASTLLEDVLIGEERLAFVMRAVGSREGRSLDATYVVLLRSTAAAWRVWSTAFDPYAVDAFWA